MSLAQPNIFDYVGKKNDEKSIHEKFIASLLKDKVLGEQIWENIKKNPNIKRIVSEEDILSFTVAEQYYLGRRPADILFQTNNHRPIILELKIDAENQEAQLWDYYTVAKRLFSKNPIIIYITLAGSDPATDTKNKPLESSKKSLFKPKDEGGKKALNKDIDYFCFSYNDLVNGLNPQKEKIISLGLKRFLLSQYDSLLSELKNRGKANKLDSQVCNKFIKSVHDALSKKINNCNLESKNLFSSNKSYKHYRITIPHPKKSQIQLCLSYFKVNSCHHIYYGLIGQQSQWKLTDYENYVKHILWQEDKKIFINSKKHPSDYPNYYKHFEEFKNRIEDNSKLNFDFLFYQNDISNFLTKYEDYLDLPIEDFAELFSTWMYYDYLCL